jgi:hypothetical protein
MLALSGYLVEREIVDTGLRARAIEAGVQRLTTSGRIREGSADQPVMAERILNPPLSSAVGLALRGR